MTPTYKEMLQGRTTWKFDHKGINYVLSHHGYRGDGQVGDVIDFYNHPGIWCYYLYANELQYPDSWGSFKNVPNEGHTSNGSAWDCVDFYGGITWSSDEPFYDRKLGRMVEQVKVGCDYNHLWDAEGFYHNGFDDVKRDAVNSVNDLLKSFPLERVRCKWSGVWVKPEDSYTALNGATVSNTAEIPEGYKMWKEGTNER